MTETEKQIRGMTDEELIREMREYSKEKAFSLFRARIMFDEAAKRMEDKEIDDQ